ncbi:MAG: DUF5615 family PIN-like protein [Syntrophothermus sp.]|uniref:DUF5615 family PIN-like protein n=1 Tax=Syntrophothermus sp. TaxID=2736299 RepID=UPI00257AF9EC|nr:DUF5615 family PIN-like protein [Syntrophothermus sp.]NSW83814.1 DUF5615 family PIN-like protein [Syntrophothermus sp.]
MKTLRYLADLHISPLTCELLRKAGYSVVRVSDVLSPAASDEEILRYACKHQMVIITQDLDFSALLAITNASQPSVITLRLAIPHPQAVAKILCQVLPGVKMDLVRGAIISVTEDKVKVRTLPVH